MKIKPLSVSETDSVLFLKACFDSTKNCEGNRRSDNQKSPHKDHHY